LKWRLPSRQARRIAWLGGPLVGWLAVIAAASTDIASEAHTKAALVGIIHLFSSGYATAPSGGGLGAVMWGIRKTAHLVEYGTLGFLGARALRGLFPNYARGAGWALYRRTVLVVAPCGLVVSVADELHQTLVRSRMGSPRDVGFDLAGLLLGVLVAWLVWRRRGSSA
jgi:hypothetical protein